jgi:hypothetical protein
VLLSVVPGAEPPAKGLAASATIALAPVIEVEQQEEGQLEAGSGGRDLQSLVDGSSPVQQQHNRAGGLQFFALPALMHSTATDATAPQASLTEPVMVGGRRSLLCFDCPKCNPGQFAVAVDGTKYGCFTCPVGFYCDGRVGGYLAKCPEQCSSCATACSACESSQVTCRSGTTYCPTCNTCLLTTGCKSWPTLGDYACDSCNDPCNGCQRCSNPAGSQCSACASCQQKCSTSTSSPAGISGYMSCSGYAPFLSGGGSRPGAVGRRLQGTGEAEAGPLNTHHISTAQE